LKKCNCSKNGCRTNICKCFKPNNKCTIRCHSNSSSIIYQSDQIPFKYMFNQISIQSDPILILVQISIQSDPISIQAKSDINPTDAIPIQVQLYINPTRSHSYTCSIRYQSNQIPFQYLFRYQSNQTPFQFKLNQISIQQMPFQFKFNYILIRPDPIPIHVQSDINPIRSHSNTCSDINPIRPHFNSN
jgi:hypothetical protein